jgi:hypothetical protein
LQRAAIGHGEHEKLNGGIRNENWPLGTLSAKHEVESVGAIGTLSVPKLTPATIVIRLWSLQGTRFSRREINAIDKPDDRQYRAPPDVGVEVKQHHPLRGRMKQFMHACPKNQQAVHQQREPDA